jgi:Protein of unknown function (DUF3237)
MAKRVFMALGPNYARRAAVEMVDEIAGVAQYAGVSLLRERIMTFLKLPCRWFYLCVISTLLFPSMMHAQTTKISMEYLMTLYAPLEAAQEIDSSLYVYNVRPGGWVKGPRINGTLLAPGGDWFRVLPSGASRLDVRATIKTDDGALIYIAYNGIFKDSEETEARASKGEILTSKDMYFVIAPTLQTAAKKYDWLNGIQCIGKMVSYKSDSYVKYDIFMVR